MDTILWSCFWFCMGFISCVLCLVVLSASVASYEVRRTIPRPKGQAVKIVGNHQRGAGQELPDVEPRPLKETT